MYSSGEINLRNGKIYLPSEKKIPALLDRVCNNCNGRGIDVKNTALLRKFRRIIRDRPETKVKYFQGNMDAESVVARVYLMDSRDSLAGKRITIVGDDDYLSIALALTGLPERITVLEIDQSIGEFIEKVAREYKLDIEYVHYNVEDPLPREFRGKSHIFSTEPLETLTGFLTFFSRGAASLRKGGVGYAGLTNLECSLSKWKKIQQEILNMGFVITDIKRRFSFYPMEPEDREYVEQVLKGVKFRVKPEKRRIWYYSHLFRVEALEDIKPLIKPEESTKIDLYDAEDDYTFPRL